MPDTQERDQQILFDRVRGDTLVEIGSRHGVSHQAVSQIVVREGRQHVDRLETQLMVARKEGNAIALVVPFQEPSDYQAVLRYWAWVLDALRARDIDIRATTRPTPNGLVLLLEDVTDYGGSE